MIMNICKINTFTNMQGLAALKKILMEDFSMISYKIKCINRLRRWAEKCESYRSEGVLVAPKEQMEDPDKEVLLQLDNVKKQIQRSPENLLISIKAVMAEKRSRWLRVVAISLSCYVAVSLCRCVPVSLGLYVTMSLFRYVDMSLSLCCYVAVLLCRCVVMLLSRYVFMLISRYASMLLCLYVAMSICHYVAMLLCWHVTMSQCCYVDMSLCRRVAMLLWISAVWLKENIIAAEFIPEILRAPQRWSLWCHHANSIGCFFC